jgi:hypothetical protein
MTSPSEIVGIWPYFPHMSAMRYRAGLAIDHAPGD